MKRLRIILLSALVLMVLAACGTDSKEEEAETDDGVGFSLSDDTIEEATNVPKDEKKAILKSFDTYIDKMNAKDLEGYMETIAEKPTSFTREEERDIVKEMFEDYDFTREPSDITVVKYSEDEAQVFSKLDNKVKQLSTGLETTEKSRQVTVFVKEKDGWKVSAVHAIGES